MSREVVEYVSYICLYALCVKFVTSLKSVTHTHDKAYTRNQVHTVFIPPNYYYYYYYVRIRESVTTKLLSVKKIHKYPLTMRV